MNDRKYCYSNTVPAFDNRIGGGYFLLSLFLLTVLGFNTIQTGAGTWYL
ncbi:hypothetical protein [Sporosarcina sp. P20a]|nr:hypothetical protein [Sporosarcina sp. P20a]